MAVTLKDVAKHAGLSIATVHQVLNGAGERFTMETREKVTVSASLLNYKTNIAARALREKKSYLIGVLYNSGNYGVLAEFMTGLQQVSKMHDYAPVFLMNMDLVLEAENIETLLQRRMDGLIVNVFLDESKGVFNSAIYNDLKERSMPMVEVFGRFISGVPSANVDNRAAGRLIVQRLVSRGHKRIVHFTHANYLDAERIPGQRLNAWEFAKGYEDEMRANGLEPIIDTHELGQDIFQLGNPYSMAYEAAERIMRHASAPTAAACFSEEEAEVLMYYADRHPESAPANFEVAALSSGYSVTTPASKRIHRLRLPILGVGKKAAELLVNLINHKTVKSELLQPYWESPA